MILSQKAEGVVLVVFALIVFGAVTLSIHVRAQESIVIDETTSDSTERKCTGDSLDQLDCEGDEGFQYDSTSGTSVGTDSGESDPSQSDEEEGSDTSNTEQDSDTTEVVSIQRPQCPIPQKAGRIIVDFGDQRLRSDREVSDARTRVHAVALAAGTYAVTLAAWDGYEGREKVTQPREQFRVSFLSDTTVVTRSAATSDLRDNVRETSKTEQVNTALEITRPITGVRAVHAAYPDTTSPNSLYPLCAAFDLHVVVVEEKHDTPETEEDLTSETDIVSDTEEERTICATDQRRCSDGSYVTRQLPNCQFAQCPVVVESKPAVVSDPVDITPDESDAGPVTTDSTAQSTLSHAEAQAMLDRLEQQRLQQQRTTGRIPPRAPTEREAEVIEERRQVLERVPQETRRFDSVAREALVRAERARRGEEEREVVTARRPGSVLNSPIDDIEALIERESGEAVTVREPRRTVVEEDRTGDFELGLQRLVYRDRMDLSVLRDSDGDGISDFDEVYIYGTDPYNAYTAGGVLTDGERIELGLDPLSTSPKRISVASPRTTGEEDPFQYTVSSIESIAGNGEGDEDTIHFRGLAPLNSLVTLVMFSEPIIVTVKANENGNWEYELSVPLEEGRHELYVTAVNSQGDIVTRSPTIPFVRTAEAIEFTPLSGATSQSGILAGNFLPIALAAFMAIGLMLLIVLGLSHRRRSVTTLHGEDTIS